MNLKTNVVFKHLQNSDKRIVIEQGGTRSGKTYNILIWIIFEYCQKHTKKTITICRKTYPSLRATVMRDFFDILKQYNLYTEEKHNKSSGEYYLNGNLVEFISLQQPSRVRGRKRDLLYINEANELFYEDYQQLMFRTSYRTIIDYNPSDEFHWIYEKVKTRDDADFFVTTYLDNPFLDQSLISEITRLKEIDKNYWQIYGLGQVGKSKAIIFTFTECDRIPEGAKFVSYGMDFGYTNDSTSLIGTYLLGDNMYIKELLYRTGMTNRDIHNEFVTLGLNRRDEIFADSAEPKSIEELYRMGWNIKPTAKGADSINIGIDMIKRYKVHITKDSLNTIKEFKNYKWVEDKNGNILNKPVDLFNHSIDALRYSIYNKLSKPNFGKYAVR